MGKEQASEEALRSAKDDAMRYTQVRGLPSREDIGALNLGTLEAVGARF